MAFAFQGPSVFIAAEDVSPSCIYGAAECLEPSPQFLASWITSSGLVVYVDVALVSGQTVVVAGTTGSEDFPVTAGAFDLYIVSKRDMRVDATSSNSTAVFTLSVTSSGAFIGTAMNYGGGKYSAQFTNVAANPVNITVKSGTATHAVTVNCRADGSFSWCFAIDLRGGAR